MEFFKNKKHVTLEG